MKTARRLKVLRKTASVRESGRFPAAAINARRGSKPEPLRPPSWVLGRCRAQKTLVLFVPSTGEVGICSRVPGRWAADGPVLVLPGPARPGPAALCLPLGPATVPSRPAGPCERRHLNFKLPPSRPVSESRAVSRMSACRGHFR